MEQAQAIAQDKEKGIFMIAFKFWLALLLKAVLRISQGESTPPALCRVVLKQCLNGKQNK